MNPRTSNAGPTARNGASPNADEPVVAPRHAATTTLAGAAQVSFEFFPPRTAESFVEWSRALAELAALRPAFVSVTYGAGGSSHDASLGAVRHAVATAATPVAAHITCVGATRRDTDERIDAFVDVGVRHFVALRGDTADGTPYAPHPDGYANATELVAATRRRLPGVELSVSAYPEHHPDSASPAADLDNLLAKQDAGADRAITQFFFDNAVFFRFVERARAHGITIPIVPGILPVRDIAQVQRFADRCGTTVPGWLVRRFAAAPPDLAPLVGLASTAEQIAELIANDVERLHLYTLNRADAASALVTLLHRPRTADPPASDLGELVEAAA